MQGGLGPGSGLWLGRGLQLSSWETEVPYQQVGKVGMKVDAFWDQWGLTGHHLCTFMSSEGQEWYLPDLQHLDF